MPESLTRIGYSLFKPPDSWNQNETVQHNEAAPPSLDGQTITQKQR